MLDSISAQGLCVYVNSTWCPSFTVLLLTNTVFWLELSHGAEVAVFDASQYAFFGKDFVEDVELGGLEDEEEDLAAVEFDEEEFLFDRQEVTSLC